MGHTYYSTILDTFGSHDLKTTQPQFDLLSAIRNLMRQSKALWAPQHVDGHRDRYVAWGNLTWWEKRNVEADLAAKNFRQLIERDFRIPSNARFFTEPSALFIAGVKQQSLSRSTIAEIVALPRVQQRWHRTGLVSPEAEPEIDREALTAAMKSLPAYIQRWLTKHSVGICGVNKFRHRWGQVSCPKCPCCGQTGPGDEAAVEDALHVPRCPDTRVAAHWQEQIDKFAQWMVQNDSHPTLQQVLLHIIWEVRQPPSEIRVPSRF